MTAVFRHPLLARPLDLQGQRDLIAAYGVFRASQNLDHQYMPKESGAHDPFVRRQRKAGR